MKSAWVSAIILLILSAVPMRAADSGKEVVVVYNSRVPASREIAYYYARKRHVPTNQVFGFSLSTGLEMSRAEFRQSLQKPLAQRLADLKLWQLGTDIIRGTNHRAIRVVWKVKQSKIRYAVLCYGVPVSIASDPAIKKDEDSSLRPELRRDEAAVDTELALLPMIDEDPPLLGPMKNALFASTNAEAFNPTNGVLMVTRLDGPTPEIARGLVDKALEAETNGLWGRAYFDLRGITNAAYREGDAWLGDAADICRKLGFETVVDRNPGTFPPEFPMSQIAIYCGWYAANVCGPFTQPHVEFMPGAFAYHLYSWSAGDLRSSTRNWVGPLLAKGATITMGCVHEPYLGGTPQVAVFLSRLIYDRMTFGEAAYAAQPVLSWQTTIVGDPLYRPYRVLPQVLHLRLQREHSKWLQWSHLRVIDLSLARGVPPSSAVAYLEKLDLTRHSAILSEKLADLYESLGKPTSAIDTYEQALELDPSPLQRVRLRLALGRDLTAANRLQKAQENYTALLREDRDYPNKTAIYRKQLALAQKLGNQDEVAKYEELIRTLHSSAATNAAAVK